jgi:signal transduction histidine kinase
VRRILALEGIRTQIATDIHDDLGSGLAQIAILTEVAKRGAPEPSLSTLDEVAKLARSMRDSMSDIVWAVDPRRDRFSDLVQRMRQAAFNLLEAEGLRVEFRAPESAEIEGIGLPPDKRRHLLLVLKESLANVARHARATKVVVDVRLEPGTLRLAVQDDGIGFDPGLDHRGNGLASLRRRAQALAGTIEIRSAPGQGTAIDVRVPLA